MMSAMDLQNNYYMSEEGKRFWACSKRGSKQEQQDAGGDEDEDEDDGEGEGANGYATGQWRGRNHTEHPRTDFFAVPPCAHLREI